MNKKAQASNKSLAIKLVSAAIDEHDTETVFRGVLSPESLQLLKIDSYQREQLTPSKIEKLAVAVCTESVPDIELSVRHSDFEITDDGEVVINGPVYIVDGQQRRAGALKALTEGGSPRLGAIVFVNKTKEWERERFLTLNLTQTRVNPNVILRNMENSSTGVKNILYLTRKDDDFVLKGRVSWDQNMGRSALIRATTVAHTAVQLHRHIINGDMVSSSGGAVNIAKNLDKIFGAMGNNIAFRHNVIKFFGIIDECWNIRDIKYRDSAGHLRAGFLVTLAAVLSSHTNFWRGQELVVDKATIAKLKKFPLRDPSVADMTKQGGNSVLPMLYQLIVAEINRGRRTGRLKSRYGFDAIPTDSADNSGSDE